MQVRTHAVNWFEIPVSDFDRAKRFYETIFGYQMPKNQMGDARMGFLLYDFQGGGRGGAIVHHPGFHAPASNGTLVYLNCDPDLSVVQEKVTAAGGKVLQEKKMIAPQTQLGYWALIEDTEGNRVALHSMN